MVVGTRENERYQHEMTLRTFILVLRFLFNVFNAKIKYFRKVSSLDIFQNFYFTAVSTCNCRLAYLDSYFKVFYALNFDVSETS